MAGITWLAGVVWLAGNAVPATADEMILNTWTARRNNSTVASRPAATSISAATGLLTATGDAVAADSSSGAAGQIPQQGTVSLRITAPANGESNKLRWHARRAGGNDESPGGNQGADAPRSEFGSERVETAQPVMSDPVIEDAPDGYPIKLTAALEPIPDGAVLQPIPASQMPRLTPPNRRAGRASYDRNGRDRAQSRIVVTAAASDEPLRDPFADEEMPPSRSRLKKSAAEPLPQRQPRPLQNDLFSDPAVKPTPGAFDEPPPTANMPSPSDSSPAPPQSLVTPELPREPLSPCEGDKKECHLALDKLKATTIDKTSLSIQITGAEGVDFPCECTLGNDPFVWRHWSATTYTFKAAGTCHKPLYFEDVQLERYGHAWNPAVQGVLSGAHFFANVILLPYHMGVNPPNECVYSLGYYRPGACAPYVIEPFPISVKGAVYELGFVATGLWVLNFYSPSLPAAAVGL